MSARRFRIVILSEDFPPYPGGIAQWAAGVACALAGLGYEVQVATRRRADYPVEHMPQGVSVEFIDGSRWRQLRTWYCHAWARRCFRDKRADAVIATTWNMARGIVPVLSKRRVALVTVTHGLEVTRNMPALKRWIMKRTLRASALVIAVSGFTGRFLRDHGLCDGSRVAVIPNGVDPRRFRPGLDSSELRRRLGLGSRRVILTLARVIERKGHDLVLRALPSVLALHPDTVYVVAGPCDGQWRRRLEALVVELEIGKHVLFTGQVASAELPLYYSLCEVYVMISREIAGDTEGFGITYLEAGACGKPVIGGRSGGVADAIAEGETGYLVDPGDADTLTRRLCELLSDPARSLAMGEAGRSRIEREFTWENAVRRILSEPPFGR